MFWVEVFVVFLVSHLVGDFLLQTDWQARNKHGGLGRDATARRALFAHVAVYTAAFLPALAWIAMQRSTALAAGIALAIALPHLALDDGRLVDSYAARVKGLRAGERGVRIAVDQSFHVVALFAAALLAVA